MNTPSDPLDLKETRRRVDDAFTLLSSVKWPEFSSVFESSAKANVGTALRHLHGVGAALEEEKKRRAGLPLGGDDRPAPGTATVFPRLPVQPTHPSRRPPRRWWLIRPMFALFAVLGFILSCLLIVLWEGGVIGW